MNITDDQLFNWTKPAFDNEEEKAEATKSAVKAAIDNYPALNGHSIKVFAKGSYANNTNVRRDSDIDIAVEFEDMINLEYFDNLTLAQTGLHPYSGISENEFKIYVLRALVKEFGEGQIDSTGNKTFKIRGSDKILDADIIPCTTYRAYFNYGYRQGIQLILNRPDGVRHFNYPDQHHTNGITKNNNTSRRYKSIVRILKNARNFIEEKTGKSNFHSFMIESLAYNVTDSKYMNGNTWREIINEVCVDAWQYLSKIEPTEEILRWTETNGHKFLFHPHQKWTRDDAKQFISTIYDLVNN